MKTFISSILILSVVAVVVFSAPGGAPEEACQGLLPSHNGTQAQNSTSPYTLSTVPELATGTYLVTVRSINANFTFKGIIIQVRNASAPESYKTFGSFSRVVPTETELQPVTCISANDTVTHTDNSEKRQVQIRWTKPANGSGIAVFR